MKHPEIEKRIKDLLSKMTLEEKVGQLHQAGGSIVGACDPSLEELLKQHMSFAVVDGLVEIHIGGSVRDTLQANVEYHNS